MLTCTLRDYVKICYDISVKKRRPIHQRVRAVLDQLELDRAAVSELTGWKDQRVYRLLAGKTSFGADDIELLSDVLRQPIDAFYRGRAA